MRRQGPQGVDLLGHLHRPELGGHGRADPAGDHQAGEHRSQLAAHADAHHRAGGGVHLDLVELEVGLRAQDHARRRAGGDDDALRLHADKVQLLDEIAPRRPLVAEGTEGLAGDVRELAELAEQVADPLLEDWDDHVAGRP